MQRLFDLRRQRRELIVDDDDAVVAGRDADVAPGAGKHVHRAGGLRHLDLDFAEMLLGKEGGGGESGQDDDPFANGAGL